MYVKDYANQKSILLKGDADASYYFSINQKEHAFKVLQERVYPPLIWFRENHIPLPFKLYSSEA